MLSTRCLAPNRVASLSRAAVLCLGLSAFWPWAWGQTPAPSARPALSETPERSAPPAGGFGSRRGLFGGHLVVAPLKPRGDVVPWELLGSVRTKFEKVGDRGHVRILFPAELQALDGQVQRIQGYMMPLEPGDRHTHFLLSAVPTNCPVCLPGGPESLVEVRADQPVPYQALAPVVVRGRLAVLQQDPMGFFYRLSDAGPVD